MVCDAAEKMIEQNSPIMQFIDKESVREIMENPDGISSPWYGQLMKAPQILAYLLQINFWLSEYGVDIEL